MATKLNIFKLLSSHEGTRQEYKVDLPVFDDEEFKIKPNQKLDFEGYKIEEGIAIRVLPIPVTGRAQCVVTLKYFDLEIETADTEKQFYTKFPEYVDPEDAGLIDKNNYEVDIEDLLREAVFLGLPPVIKCPEAEKAGPVEAGDKFDDSSTQKPFEGLKDMLEE